MISSSTRYLLQYKCAEMPQPPISESMSPFFQGISHLPGQDLQNGTLC